MLRIRGLRRQGLGPVDLDLAAGECTVVTGVSGSGKSLLLRAIADLDPSDGAVSLDGADRAAIPAPEWRRRVGYLAAEPGWWADTVAEHFEHPDAAAGFIVALGLEPGVLKARVDILSTGERQRLALARLIAGGPGVLLLDEPTSAVDSDNVARVEAVVRERLANGRAVLMVSHDRAQALRIATRRMSMVAGRLTEIAP